MIILTYYSIIQHVTFKKTLPVVAVDMIINVIIDRLEEES